MNVVKKRILRALPESFRQLVRKIYYAYKLRFSVRVESNQVEVIRSVVAPGDCAIDVGANIGVYTILLSRLVGHSGTVHAFEPVPQTFRILSFNTRVFGLRNVSLHDCAISRADGTVSMQIPFYTDGEEHFYLASVADRSDPTCRKIQVRAGTLDGCRQSMGRVSFIKCDVEGHELECVQGAQQLIRRDKPGWYIEVTQNPDDEHSKAYELFKVMERHGYKAYILKNIRLKERRFGDHNNDYFFLTEKHLQRFRANRNRAPASRLCRRCKAEALENAW